VERASPELPLNAVRLQIVVRDAVGLKTQKSISAVALPRTPLGSLHRSPIPYSWWGGELAAPCPRTPPRHGPSGLKLWPFGPLTLALRASQLRASSLLTVFRRPGCCNLFTVSNLGLLLADHFLSRFVTCIQ